MSKSKIIRLKPGQPLTDLLPKLPKFEPRPFACAIAVLEHEIDRWTEDRETDPEVADKTVADCKEAVEVLLAERSRRELIRKILDSGKVLPPNV